MNILKYRTVLLVSLVLFFSSCDVLQNQEPQQSLALETAYENAADLDAALVGSYSDLQVGELGAADWIITSEVISDNASWVGSFEEYTQVGAHDMVPSNGIMTGWWTNSYELINDVNLILEQLPDAENVSQEQNDRIRGEALFIRGITYFEMARVYGIPYTVGDPSSNPAVPLVLESTRGSDEFTSPSRASVQAVYDQVLADLEEASSLLPATNSAGRATSFAALGYLARVELQMGDYADAASYAGQVLGGNFSLRTEVTAPFFDEGGSEEVYSIVNTEQDNPGTNAALATFFNIGGRDDVQLTSDFITAMANLDKIPPTNEPTFPSDWEVYDTRRTELITDADAATAGHQIGTSSNTMKYDDFINFSDNAPTIRLADIMLIRAEALAENAANLATVPQEVFDHLNAIRVRALRVNNAGGGPEDPAPHVSYERADFTNKQELIDAILLERRIELAFEGQRYHDLVRRNMDVSGDPAGSDNTIFPIPQRERDANPNISQNPGY